VQHAGALKDAIVASKAEVKEAKEQLRQELEKERKLRKLEKEQNDKLSLDQASVDQLIKDLDAKARSTYFAFAYKLSLLTVYSYTGLF
jgi:antirestriction protein